MRRVLVLVSVILMIGATAWASQRVDTARDVDPTGSVTVSNIAGEIVFEGWDRAEVQVTGTLDDAAERLDFEVEGSRTRIEVKYPRNVRTMDGSFLKVMVPVASQVSGEGVSSDITMTGLRGRVEAETVSGDVKISAGPEKIEAASVSGDVTIDLAPDDTEAATVSGDVLIREAGGSLEAASVSGEIEVKSGVLRDGEFETVSGDIYLGVALADGDLEIESVSGAITLMLEGSASADFEIDTFSGSIRNRLTGDSPVRTSKHTPGSELEFSTGSGGSRVSISSFSGSVTLAYR